MQGPPANPFAACSSRRRVLRYPRTIPRPGAAAARPPLQGGRAVPLALEPQVGEHDPRADRGGPPPQVSASPPMHVPPRSHAMSRHSHVAIATAVRRAHDTGLLGFRVTVLS